VTLKIAESDYNTLVPETTDFPTVYGVRQRSHSLESLSLFRDGDGAMVEQGKSELLEGLRVNFDYFAGDAGCCRVARKLPSCAPRFAG
jgi:hypothetical protein